MKWPCFFLFKKLLQIDVLQSEDVIFEENICELEVALKLKRAFFAVVFERKKGKNSQKLNTSRESFSLFN